jgi:periplasmic protein CpxP/Spy
MNKLHFVALMALAGLLALNPMAQAADQNGEKPARKAKAADGLRPKAQNRQKQIAEELKLTSEQREQLKPIIQEEAKKAKELRQDTKLSRQDRMGKLKEIREETSKKVKPVLTAEQFEKWQKLHEQSPKRKRQQ